MQVGELGQKGRRLGMIPRELKRRSLVTVERLARPGEVGEMMMGERERDMTVLDSYIVESRRLDGVWIHKVALRGEETRLPGRVIDTINRHRESIIKEGRSRRAKERFLAQAEAVAQGR